MSQFYVSPWSGGWNVPSDAGSTWATYGGHGQGWATSWDEVASQESMMARKQEPRSGSTPGSAIAAAQPIQVGSNSGMIPSVTSSNYSSGSSSVSSSSPVSPTLQNAFGLGAQVGFGEASAEGLTSPAPGPRFDASTTTYYEILPGQGWDAVVPSSVPQKAYYATSTPQNAPNSTKASIKPSTPLASQEWVEVTSADSWITPASQVSPTTSNKQRQKFEPQSPPLQGPIQTPTGGVPPTTPSQGPPGNHKRHHDIEDELGHQDRYKTELCRSWHDNGTCRYGSKCQFAHGAHELRPVMRHPKYKTELCRSWVETRSCPYGRRCRFIHQDHPTPVVNHMDHMQSRGTPNASSVQFQQHGQHALMQQQQQQSLMNGSSHMGQPQHMQHLHAPQQQQQQVIHQQSHSSVNQLSQQFQTFQPFETGFQSDFSSSVYGSTDSLSANSALSMNGGSYHHYQHQHQHQHQHQQHYHRQGQFVQQPVASASPPFGTMGFTGTNGVHVFGRSPPHSPSSARAANPAWLSDTFQDDDEDDDLAGNGTTLTYTPLIEQLNRYAEPISPSASAQSQRPAPIGSATPIGVSPSSNSPSTQASPEPVVDGTEKAKKKKGPRLGIFQRLSTK